ncbi:hypothetical protein L195_g039905, partial [Trifolium pratense]
MEPTRICALVMVYSLALCILTSDMSMKLEGRELDGACKSDGQCQSGCPVGRHGEDMEYVNMDDVGVMNHHQQRLQKNLMELVNQMGNVNLGVRLEDMEYVNMDVVGVMNHHQQRLQKNLTGLVNQMGNANLDVRLEDMEYVNTDDVGVMNHH